MRVAALVAVVVLAGCVTIDRRSPDDSTVAPRDEGLTPLPRPSESWNLTAEPLREPEGVLRTVAWGRVNSGYPRRDRLVIDNESAWGDLWREMIRSDDAPAPIIDFGAERLVAAFGVDGCYSSQIAIVEVRDEEAITVLVHEAKGTGGAGCLATRAYSHHLATVARTAQDIRFVDGTAELAPMPTECVLEDLRIAPDPPQVGRPLRFVGTVGNCGPLPAVVGFSCPRAGAEPVWPQFADARAATNAACPTEWRVVMPGERWTVERAASCDGGAQPGDRSRATWMRTNPFGEAWTTKWDVPCADAGGG